MKVYVLRKLTLGIRLLIYSLFTSQIKILSLTLLVVLLMFAVKVGDFGVKLADYALNSISMPFSSDVATVISTPQKLHSGGAGCLQEKGVGELGVTDPR